ncbi:MAG: cysteine--tRNA ligase [Candidatus Omnitrophota bacterium]|nr:cysteine--tRNA ligase [Candidatus Omnitrophota bacterium]
MYIYNSLSRKKEEFIPLNPLKVNIYTCGVTVYDESHLGHARSLYVGDVIRRYLKYRGYRVRFVRNITDIDDKIIKRANELKISWQELVKKYIDSYFKDLAILGIEKADFEPAATENIPDMIKSISVLIEKGFAYLAGGDVYFNVRKFLEYGKLSGQNIAQMSTGVRIEPTEFKKDHLDFVLWKKSKPEEPYWDSPWGEGRPGWHIECSVMSMKYLECETLDIHAGGRDLIFPHHENEIAQSKALTGKPFAKYWMHHGLLTIKGQKMAKSLGNFITIKDFALRYHDVDLLKLFFLSAHYSHPIDYSEEKIEEAKKALGRILILIDKIERKRPVIDNQKSASEIESSKERFIQAMDDDFNMPQALASVFELVNLANKNIDDLGFVFNAENTIKELLGILGVSLKAGLGAGGFGLSQQDSILTKEEIEDKILERQQARNKKDYELADKIRRELEEKGIILEDTQEGAVWRKRL